jgi:hypothetical protein
MEDNKTSMMKHAMTYGAIIGLSLVVYSVLLYITGLTFNKALGLIQYVVLFAGLYFGTKAYRDKVLGGFITYGKALGLGVLISVFVGIITVFFNFIMMRFVDPGLIDKYMAILEETYQNSRFIPADQVDGLLEKGREAMTAVWTLPVGVLSFSFFGFIISLITSIFVKQDPNPVA